MPSHTANGVRYTLWESRTFCTVLAGCPRQIQGCRLEILTPGSQEPGTQKVAL